MSRSTIDRSELEGRLRSALRARADLTPVRPPDRFVAGSPAAYRPGPARRPVRALVAGAAAVAAAVLAIVAVAARPDGGGDGAVRTRPPTDAPAGLRVSGPSGSRWFVLDLPGVTATGAYREDRNAADDTPPGVTLQAYRTPAGFAGPAVWVESMPAAEAISAVGEGATPTTVQGRPAALRQDGQVVTLGGSHGAGNSFLITAVNLPAEDAVAFAEGLRPRREGWDATALPRGLTAVAIAGTGGGEYAEWSYTGPGGANYELFVTPGGEVAFEGWAREHVASGGTVEPISVDGRPGLVVGGEGEQVALWQPTDDVVVDFRTSGSVDDLVAALEALRPVDEAAWLAHLPAGVRP